MLVHAKELKLDLGFNQVCESYWELRQEVEVVCGPKSMLRKLRGLQLPDDLAMYWGDAVDGQVFKLALPGFSSRSVLIGGLPHASPEDIFLSLPLNPGYLDPSELKMLPQADWDWVIFKARFLGGKYLSSIMNILNELVEKQ